MFTPTDKEKSSKVLHLRYDSTKDQYCRVSNNCELIGGWDQCVSSKEALFRKEENDWQMVCFFHSAQSGFTDWVLDLLLAGSCRPSWCYSNSFLQMKPLFERKDTAEAQRMKDLILNSGGIVILPVSDHHSENEVVQSFF